MPYAKKTVLVVATQHLDVAWLWKRHPDGEALMRQCFQRALEMIHADPDGKFVFSRSTAWSFHILEQQDPELFQQVREEVRDGRLELCGGQWVEPDNVIPSGESLVRQGLYGQLYFEETFGKTAEVCWNPDVFCHGNTLPQILRATGLRGYYFHRCRPVDSHGTALAQFRWQAPDGSTVICFAGNWLDAPQRESLVHAAAASETDTAHYVAGRRSDRRITMDSSWLVRLVEQTADAGLPTVCWATAGDVLQALEQRADQLPTVHGDLGGYLFTGTYTSDQITKRYNRKLEGALAEAEALATAAYGDPADYPKNELRGAWRDLCVNQFHDIICGTCYREVQEEAYELYRSIEEQASRIAGEAMDGLASSCSTDEADGVPIVVWNGLSVPRSAPVIVGLPEELTGPIRVTDAGGTETPSQAVASGDGRQIVFTPSWPVPALGGAVYYLRQSAAAAAHSGPISRAPKPVVLENPYVRVELDRNSGDIVSLILKSVEAKLIRLGGRGNRIAVHEDANDFTHSLEHRWDPWFINYTGRRYDPVGVYDVRTVEDGPVRTVVRVIRSMSLHPAMPPTRIQQDIILYADSPILTFATSGEWYAQEAMVTAEFDVTVEADSIVAEMPYGVIRRPSEFSRVAGGRQEPDRPMQRWLDVSDGEIGIALLNDGKYGYSSSRTGVSLSLMRAPRIRYDEIAGLGPFEFSYAVLPHVGTWREAHVPAAAASFNRPLYCRTAPRHGGYSAEIPSLLQVDPPGVLVGAVKRAERSHDLVVRLYESLGTTCTAEILLGGSVQSAWETDALERPIPGGDVNRSEDGRQCSLSFRPFEVKTVVLRQA